MLKHHQGDPASLQVLLIPDIFVRRHDEVETGLLGDLDQLAICEFFPPARPGLLHGMTGKETGKSSWRAVVEKNAHPASFYP
jgi:hypothetical protein